MAAALGILGSVAKGIAKEVPKVAKTVAKNAAPALKSLAKNREQASQQESSSSSQMAEPSEYSHGGEVKKTGLALVHKGERVLSKDDIMHNTYGLAADKMSGGEHKPEKVIHHITTRKSANGGHIHEHHHTHPEHHPMEEHATQGDDGMVEHMMDNMGSPNPGEAEADAGQSGIGASAPAAPPTGAAPSMGA